MVIVRMEALGKLETYAVTSLGTQSVTLRLVAQRLNQISDSPACSTASQPNQ
jgi:hypothetical protein